MAKLLVIRIEKIENGFTIISTVPATPFIPAYGDVPAIPANPPVQKSYYAADNTTLNAYLVSLATANFGE